jgi:nucleotide-binding universal stress UspA family protein
MAAAMPRTTGVSIQKVLIATDFSRLSLEILHGGMNFCHAYGAHAYVLYVLPQTEFALAGFEAYAAARDAANRDMHKLDEQLRQQYSREQGKDYDLLISEGDVAGSILATARDKHIDLIVVGTHGRKGLSKAFLGSVAESIFRHSDIPVLTIGPQARHLPPSGPRRLLVPVDFTAASQHSARYACALAREHHADLLLIHAIEDAKGGALADLECLKHTVEQSLAELVQCETEPGRVQFVARLGKAVSTILDAASEFEADMMVVGVHTYPGLLDYLRSQTAYDLVREAPCPVLTVR